MLLQEHLRHLPDSSFNFVYCAEPAEALDDLSRNPCDMIFLDYLLLPQTGLEVLKRIRGAGNLSPVIVVTGQGDEYIAADLTRAGADEYIVKQDLNSDVLRKAMENARHRHQQRVAERELAQRNATIEKLSMELTQANLELVRLSRVDHLTRVLNRGAWEESVVVEHERAARFDRSYGILMVDVDHFKQYNDSQGHQAGDDALKRIAACLIQSVREIDVVGRYGGEEFIILTPETERAGATALAERLRVAIRDLQIRHPASPTAPFITTSVGVANSPSPDWQDVVRRADQALYLAKRSGRDQVCVNAEECSRPPGPNAPAPCRTV